MNAFFDSLDDIQVLQGKLEGLREAIKKHRDQRGDDRCWLDDADLYAELNLPRTTEGSTLPPKCEFLKSCERFWEQRQTPYEKRILPI